MQEKIWVKIRDAKRGLSIEVEDISTATESMERLRKWGQQHTQETLDGKNSWKQG